MKSNSESKHTGVRTPSGPVMYEDPKKWPKSLCAGFLSPLVKSFGNVSFRASIKNLRKTNQLDKTIYLFNRDSPHTLDVN